MTLALENLALYRVVFPPGELFMRRRGDLCELSSHVRGPLRPERLDWRCGAHGDHLWPALELGAAPVQTVVSLVVMCISPCGREA